MRETDRSSSALERFHPLIRAWFAQNVGTPTDIQQQAWPAIAPGRHVLVSAPTGSGKTLAAFLWAVNQMVTTEWPIGQGVRALYVSPLKALNNDINRNLAGPLLELRQVFQRAGVVLPAIRVMTRSGDTPAGDRARMLRRPPDILITTPESLNILLTSRRGRALFAPPENHDESRSRAIAPLRTVILDEIHAVAGTRRGTHLMSAVERLVETTGEFQRIALSATVRPLETVAQFVGGYALNVLEPGASSDRYEYTRRPVAVLESQTPKRIEVRVCAPTDIAHEFSATAGEADEPPEDQEPDEDGVWRAMAREYRTIIARNRSTLFFTNSRRLAEKMARLINEGTEEPLALCHHGSLSREIRLLVEDRLKSGGLRAIVATSSLELGIDIGSVDEVILIQTPRQVASTLQRVGRAGHGVGQTSRGAIYPAHSRDILDAAVMARAVDDRAIEPVQPPESPLDVIAQVIVSMVANQERYIEDVYARLRCVHSCHGLERRAFDLVLEMLAGRYADSRIRELRPRISIDRIHGKIRGRENVERVLYMSGGTIPDRGYFDLRVSESNAKIGQLDEEFVWERSIGEVFALGNHHWQILDITHNDVIVAPGQPHHDVAIVPFWRADLEDRGAHFSERLADFLQDVDTRLASADRETAFENILDEFQTRYHLDAATAARLFAFLQRQRAVTGSSLPHRQHVLVEFFRDPAAGGERLQVIVHTFWGGRCNRPLALVFQAAWREKYGAEIQAIHNDDAVLLILPDEISAHELFALVQPERIEEYLRVVLEPGGFFGARFRESAGRALLLPPSGFGQRLPLWLNRLRSKKLLTAIRKYRDFPILLETWRTCFRDSFEIERLRELLIEVQAGTIELGETRTRVASPFAADLVWRDTNVFMYASDAHPGLARENRPGAHGDTTTLDQELLDQVVFSSRHRPRIAEALRLEFETKLKRTAPGYAPRTPVEILEWVRDRVALPVAEWQELVAAIVRDLTGDNVRDVGQVETEIQEIITQLQSHVIAAILPGAQTPVIIALDQFARITQLTSFAQFDPDAGNASPVELVAQFLRYYGPVAPEWPAAVFGFQADGDLILRELIETRRIIFAPLLADTDAAFVCDAENFESLLRMSRRRARPQVPTWPLENLPAFLAEMQNVISLSTRGEQSSGVESSGERLDRLRRVFEQLMGYPARAGAWERDILPARVQPYYVSFIDGLFAEHDLVWFGGTVPETTIAFAFADDLALFATQPAPAPEDLNVLNELRTGSRSEMELARTTGADSGALSDTLWSMAWRGLLSTENFSSVRRGVQRRFRREAVAQNNAMSAGARRTRGWSRRGARLAVQDRWFALYPLDQSFDPDDLLAEAEMIRERVRVLFARYGILFRELLLNEAPLLRWSAVFRQLRLMELSGEITGGYFFDGVAGLQFMSPAAYRLFRRGPDAAVLWGLAATDPASLAGIQSHNENFRRLNLPERKDGIYYVFRGDGKVLMIVRRKLSALQFFCEPGDPAIGDCLKYFSCLLARDFEAPVAIQLTTINAVPALKSPYRADLVAFGFVPDFKYLTLRRPPL